MHRRRQSPAVCISSAKYARGLNARTRGFLAPAYVSQPGIDRWPGRYSLQFATQVFLHRLAALCGSHRKLIAYLFGYPSDCYLHSHESILQALMAYRKQRCIPDGRIAAFDPIPP